MACIACDMMLGSNGFTIHSAIKGECALAGLAEYADAQVARIMREKCVLAKGGVLREGFDLGVRAAVYDYLGRMLQ